MTSSGAGYDLSSGTYSPDGRIFQVEYAAKAVEERSTVIGVRCSDGIVFAVEKLLVSKMLVKGTNRHLHSVDRHAGLAHAGLVADGRQLVNEAQSACQAYKKNYGASITPEALTDRLSQFVHYYTCHGWLRPFGTTIMVAAYDQETKDHQLSMIEPSGIAFRYYGCAAGKGRQTAKTEIEKQKLFNMTCREVLPHVAKILRVVHDDSKDKPYELEMSWLCEENGWTHKMVPAHLIKEADDWAVAQIEAEDEEDDDDDDE